MIYDISDRSRDLRDQVDQERSEIDMLNIISDMPEEFWFAI